MRLLDVHDLTVSFPTMDGVVRAVRGVSFGVDRGATLGVVGESGSGKSVTALTLLGLTRSAEVCGTAVFDGRDLLGLTERELREVRGARISMIFQDPLSSLHPYYRIGAQIAELIREHTRCGRAEAYRRAAGLLATVGIAQPDRRVHDYPHQFSGGMRQRVMIAMALALSPALVIADEPTTALDSTVQAQILDLLKRLQAEFGTALIIISHSLGVIAEIADQVLVMYAGRAVEVAERRTAYYFTHHPYTLGLLASVPTADRSAAGPRQLLPIPGQPPSLIRLPSGCAFHPRCRYAMHRCRNQDPPLRPVAGGHGHLSACWLPPEAVGTAGDAETRRRAAVAGAGTTATEPNGPTGADRGASRAGTTIEAGGA